MEYELFLQSVREDLGDRLGPDYTVTLRSIPKNNGIIWDGVSICRKEEEISPTIYLNEFYQEMKNGLSVSEICDSIYRLYLTNPGLPYLDSRVLSSYQEIKDHIVYKLVNTRANAAFLTHLPHWEFQDMSLICYLLMEQRVHGYVTALIHQDHLKSWGISQNELMRSALANTPRLLPPVIRPMSDVLKQLAREAMGDEYDETAVDSLLEAADEQRMERNPVFPTLYVLSNPAGVNGAACMLYPGEIRKFAAHLNQDLVILPSSIHEVLLVADSGNYDFDDMSRLVQNINETEVPPEDRLSNQIYRYSRKDDQIVIVSHGADLPGRGDEQSVPQGIL